jgi:hypothetical protein
MGFPQKKPVGHAWRRRGTAASDQWARAHCPRFGERRGGGHVEWIVAEKAQRGQQGGLRRVRVDRARQGLLGELLARGVGGQRQVGVGRHRVAE